VATINPVTTTLRSQSDVIDAETGDVAALEVNERSSPLAELGATGLKRAAGYLDEEFLPALRGRKAVAVYREMEENCAPIGGMLLAIDKLVRDVDWTVTPAGNSRDAAQAAMFVESCLDDMSQSWADTVGEILSCCTYGWSWHEVVYKVRGGLWGKDGRTRSKYDDQMIGWRKMPPRSQDSFQRWIFDESGGVKGMVQMPAPRYQQIVLPIERSLLFRFGHRKNSPEGRSMLRSAYQAWYYLKRLQESEAIGVERDLAGLPVIRIPASMLDAPPGSKDAKMVMAMTKLARSMRRNEKEGIVFPQAWDEETKQALYDIELMASGGQRQHDTDALITRYKTDILMSCLADFLLVGHEDTGTYNMHLDKTGLFKATLNSTVGMVSDVMNRHAIPRLFAVNRWRPSELPKIEPSDVDAPNLTELSSFLTATQGLGIAWAPDDVLETFLRKAAGLPEMNKQERGRERIITRRTEAVRFMTAQMTELQTRQQLAQAMATEAMTRSGMPTPDMAAQEQQSALPPGTQGPGTSTPGSAAPTAPGQQQGQNGTQPTTPATPGAPSAP
jgi:hypothetical protein